MELLLSTYFSQILSVSLIAIFMAISPGADFIMTTRNSIFYGRKSGIYSALGISVAIWIHVAYCIAGLAIIISSSIILFSIIKYLGAIYLIYIGWKTFTSNTTLDTNSSIKNNHISNFNSFKIGFISNALNPKTTIFFLSIFTQVVDIHTPIIVQIIYGLIISLAHFIWFGSVALFLSHPFLLKKFASYKNKIEKVVGTILIGFGCKIAMSST